MLSSSTSIIIISIINNDDDDDADDDDIHTYLGLRHQRWLADALASGFVEDAVSSDHFDDHETGTVHVGFETAVRGWANHFRCQIDLEKRKK